jgi:virulence-associated protein VagC
METIIRPISNIGGYSRQISLPKTWIVEQNVKKHVKITRKGKALIIEAVEG